MKVVSDTGLGAAVCQRLALVTVCNERSRLEGIPENVDRFKPCRQHKVGRAKTLSESIPPSSV